MMVVIVKGKGVAKDVKQRMVETAAFALARKGLQGASFSEVLAASGAPRGSLYHHFPGGKNELVLDAVDAAADFLLAALDERRGRPAIEIAERGHAVSATTWSAARLSMRFGSTSSPLCRLRSCSDRPGNGARLVVPVTVKVYAPSLCSMPESQSRSAPPSRIFPARRSAGAPWVRARRPYRRPRPRAS